MNKLIKIMGAALCMFSVLSSAACGGSGGGKTNNCNLYFADYECINHINDVAAYDAGIINNDPIDDGIVYSPFYTLKINGVSMPVYAARTASGAHSFAYIDVEPAAGTQKFTLDVEIALSDKSEVLSAKKPSVDVLPESSGVKAEISGSKVKAQISDYGSFSFAFNKKPDEALTLMVAEKLDENKAFGDYEIKYIEPNDYTSAENKKATVFTEGNKVYYFKAGRYKTDTISLCSDSVLYFERGAYLEVMPPESGANNVLTARGKNIRVLGRGLIDISACCGSENVSTGNYNNKGGIIFDFVENVEFSGITVINSQTWTVCFNACKNVKANNCMLFAYRTFSDGIMLSDCIDAVVENSFIHTGDDGFETKSTTGSIEPMKNVVFRNNACWTDKAVAYGCIYESNKDTSGVRFENCSVGFAMGTWSNHLGCCVIQMGNRPEAQMSKIYFDNIEVFYNRTPGLCNVYIGGSGGRGAGYGIVKNIFFKNVNAKFNFGAYLNLYTYDSENCFIYDLYLDNIVANGEKLTAGNFKKKGYVSVSVAGGYDMDRYLHINEKSE